jgi:hypothetical protein
MFFEITYFVEYTLGNVMVRKLNMYFLYVLSCLNKSVLLENLFLKKRLIY